jgi:hypothetical protein
MATELYEYEVPEFCLGEAMAEINRRGGWLKTMSDPKNGVAVIEAEMDAESQKSYDSWLAELIAKGPQGTPPWCSFCGKGKNEVERMIPGPGPGAAVHICNECVLVCQEIIEKG